MRQSSSQRANPSTCHLPMIFPPLASSVIMMPPCQWCQSENSVSTQLKTLRLFNLTQMPVSHLHQCSGRDTGCGRWPSGPSEKPRTRRPPARRAITWWWLIMTLTTIQTGLVENLQCIRCYGNSESLCLGSCPGIEHWLLDWLIFIVLLQE